VNNQRIDTDNPKLISIRIKRMPAYKAPLHDIRFLMNEVLDYPAHYQNLSNGEYADADTVDMILEGAADFCENVLSPLNQSGDEEGCHFENGEVKTPKGFKEAYDQFVQGGWQGLSYPEEFGGQNLPMSLNLIKSEMMGTANWSFQMYPGLSVGCINTIMQYGTDEQKNTYLPHLVAGTWAGTMCLTDQHAKTFRCRYTAYFGLIEKGRRFAIGHFIGPFKL
jgi:alkylation response protein AidB-like acyl-CoA dehydrogenase